MSDSVVDGGDTLTQESGAEAMEVEASSGTSRAGSKKQGRRAKKRHKGKSRKY